MIYPFFGIIVLLTVAIAFSLDRRSIRLRVVLLAFMCQCVIGALMLRIPATRDAFAWVANQVNVLISCTDTGVNLIFGDLAAAKNSVFVHILPVIVFFSTLISVCYHLGLMQAIIRIVGGALRYAIGVSRLEAMFVAANILVGQTESPLVIGPFLPMLTPSQVFAVMTSGMAGVAGTMFVLYAALGVPVAHLLAASVMSAPGALLIAKIMMPDRVPSTEGDERYDTYHREGNIIMAAGSGAQQGLKLAASVGAIILAFVSLVTLSDKMAGSIGGWFGHPELRLEVILVFVLTPIFRVLGLDQNSAGPIAGLFGERLILNEIVAYSNLHAIVGHISPKARIFADFALCGFANIGSVAIQLATFSQLAPNLRQLVGRLGPRALLAASIANLINAELAVLFTV